MLRHVVLLTLDHGADVGAVAAALRRLPDLIEEIRTYEVLADAGLADGNAQVAVIATFDDEEGWRAYTDHPEHRQVIAEHVRPHLVGRSAVQAAV